MNLVGHDPRYESSDPGAGCNATHVARARSKWKRITARQDRHENNHVGEVS